MKKIIIAGAVIAAGAAGAYFVTQQPAAPSYNVLEYIPADTPLFAAQLQPFPLKDYIKSAPKLIDPAEQQKITAAYDPAQPGKNFILSLIKTYDNGLSDADLLIKTFGLADDVRIYFYTIGLLPVFKIEVENPQAIWDLLDKTEKESGFSHQSGTLQNINYRSYSIGDASDTVNVGEVIVAIDNGLLTITLNSPYLEPSLLASALGLVKAPQSLADSGTVDKLIKKYQFKDASLAFFNHAELVKGLTTNDGNQLAKQITTLQQNMGSEDYFSELRNQQCASELAAIAANWPLTVAGYTQLDISAKESTLALSTIVESNNQVILNALSAIRGFIPSYIDDVQNNVIAAGLGFDVAKLSSTINTLWKDLQTPSYQCQPLAGLQAQIQQSGDMVAMAGMGASFANGVKGISVGLLDYTISNTENSTQLDSLDAIFTISADTPELLFNTVKLFLPELQTLQISADGKPVSLAKRFPISRQYNLDPQIAIKGQHIVIYNGKKGEQAANALSSETVSQNGLFGFSFDFKKMVTPIITATEMADQTIPAEAMFLTEYDARLQMSFDVNEQGLIFKSKINNKAPK